MTPENKMASLRVDFAGGWLDVPAYQIPGAYIVNCSISPLVSADNWPYRIGSGLGGSGAWWLLQGKDPVAQELAIGSGWQDGAIAIETGLCVWKSGDEPVLDFKGEYDFLTGRLAIYDTGIPHNTPNLSAMARDYEQIAAASILARAAVIQKDICGLARAIEMTYRVQLQEGMVPLPEIPTALGYKYCGSGHGGYGVYLFSNAQDRTVAVKMQADLTAVEPYQK